MKPPKEKAKLKDKTDTADYLETIGGLDKQTARELAKVTDTNATYEQIAESVKAGIK